MSETENVTLIEMTVDVIAAYISNNHIRATELPELISTVHASLTGMGSAPMAEPEPGKLVPHVSIRKSITDDYLISQENGQRYQSLKKHLTKHGLTPEQYRTKWGLPVDYPMIAPAYARERSKMAKAYGFGKIRRKD